jgi:N-acetyl-gamma-glutamyl-phosphate reductase
MISAILGSTGYVGQVLLRLLLSHPHIDQVIPVSASATGDKVLDRDPGLNPGSVAKLELCGGRYVSIADALSSGPDVVFAALPHLKSAQTAGKFFGTTVVIDLSADFRITDPERFLQAYGQAPPRPDLLDRAVYGLSEWYRKEIAGADLIANPGCYPTATLLPCCP